MMQNIDWNWIAEQDSLAYKAGFLNALQVAGIQGFGGAGGVNLRGGIVKKRVTGTNGGGLYASVVPTVLAQHPGCTLAELFDYAKAINPGINKNGLQAYLATAKKNHLLRAKGGRGHMKYSLAGRVTT